MSTSSLPPPTEPEVGEQISPFTLLPGELRNRIYAFCVEPKPRNLLRKPRINVNNGRLFGEYGNLQYVCQQTRTEFSPIYMARTEIVVHQPRINSFIEAFYPEITKVVAKAKVQKEAQILPNFAPKPRSRVHGNIHVATYFGFQFDATLLIHLCMQYPAIRVHFYEASASLGLSSEVDEFFARISFGSFRPDLQHTFESIMIRCSRGPLVSFKAHARMAMEDLLRRTEGLDVRQRLMGKDAAPMEHFHIRLTTDDDARNSLPEQRM